MATRARDLRFTVSADTEKLQRALNRASQSSQRYASGTKRDLEKSGKAAVIAQGHMREVTKTGLSAARSWVRLGVAAAGFASVTRYVQGATSSFEDLAKATKALSRISGMSEQDSSRWIEAAKLRGVGAKQLNQGFITLSRSMQAATDSGSDQAKMFRDLGVSSATIKKGDTQAAILGISDAWAKLPDGANKSAMAQKLFGRQAQTMLPLLNKGSDALQEQLGLSDKYGTTLDKNMVEKGLAAAAAGRELDMAMDGLKIQVGAALLPVIDKGKKLFTEFFVAVRTGKGPIGGFAQDVAGVARTLGSIVGPAIAGAAKLFGKLPEAIQKASLAFAAVGVVMLATTGPVGLGIAAIAAGAVLIKRNWSSIAPTFNAVAGALSTAFSSAKQWVGDAIGNISRWLNLGGSNMSQFGRAATNAFNILKGALRVAVGIFRWGFENVMLPIIRRVLPAIQQYVAGVFQTIGGIIKIFTGIFTGDWKKAWEGVKQVLRGALNVVLGMLRATTAPLRAAAAAAFRGVVNGIKALAGAIYGAGKWVLNRAIDGIQAAGGAAVDVGKWAGRKVVSGIKAVSGAIAGAGRWLVSRVGDGISAAVSALASIGKKIATTIINAVKSALGIRSPSTVFREIGQHMITGLAQGINPSNVGGLLSTAFGGTGKFVKAMVGKGFASIKNLPGKFLNLFGGGGGGGDVNGLVAQVRRALAWAKAHGWSGIVKDGFRTYEEQAVLYQKYLNGTGNLAARPGTSNHEGGEAVDVTDAEGFARAMASAPSNARLSRGVPGEPWHFSVTGNARGGKYNSPAFFFAEEAPRFPEYYISTNPRDRDRMIPLVMEAAHDVGIPGFKTGKKQKAKTHRAVTNYQKKFDLADATTQAGLKVPKGLGSAVGKTIDDQLKKVDKLLKLKGLSYDDRIALLNLRATLIQAKAAALENPAAGDGGGGDGGSGSGSGDGADQTPAVDPQIFIDLKQSLDELTAAIAASSKLSAVELLQLVGDMRDGQIGGSAADAFRIANAKAVYT